MAEGTLNLLWDDSGQLTLDWQPKPFMEPPVWSVPAEFRWKPIREVTVAEEWL